MPHTPAVSVIMPTHNCLPWLPQAIASVGQLPDVEIIVFDDGSSDGTQAWLTDAARSDPRIVVLNGTGFGPAKARNLAIAAARAPLLAFLDADDRWYPGKLELQLALHRAWPEAGFSFTDYRHVTPDGTDLGGCFAYWPRFHARIKGRTEPFALGGDALAQIFAEHVVGTSAVVARTDLVRAEGGFSEDLPSSEDWDLWLRLAQRSQVMCVPRVLTDYLMHRPGNVTGKTRARLLAVRMISARHEAAVRAISRGAVRVFAARMLEARAEIAESGGKRGRAIAFRMVAVARDPSRRAARGLLRALAGTLWRGKAVGEAG
jgi:glycosyltransferase involved in cell wall biosynthesis